jgi:hypothetical protein
MVPVITGGEVAVTMTPGGEAALALPPGRDQVGPLVVYRDGAGHTLVVPDAALPLLGRVLSPSLFDVSVLARDHITGAARIPVRLRFAHGTRPTAPPGVTLTSVHGHVALGYLPAASARTFGAALARQARTAARTGVLFGNLAGVSLAAPGGWPVAAPAGGHLHTVRVLLTGLTGRPDSRAGIFVTDTDDARLTPDGGFVAPIHGVGTFKAPPGHYSLNVGFTDGPVRNPASLHVVEVNDITVPTASPVTTVRVRETSATTRVALTHTPRPVAGQDAVLVYNRVSVKGPAGGVDYVLFGVDHHQVFVNPQPAAKVGKLQYLAWWSAPGPARGHYGYQVAAFAGDTIPAHQRVSVQPSQVATVVNQASADPASGGGAGGINFSPYAPGLYTGQHTSTEPALRYPLTVTGISAGFAAPVPGTFTSYLVGPPGEPWALGADIPGKSGDTFLSSDLRTFPARHTATVTWAHGPLAPRLGQHTSPWICQACVAGHTLTLVFSPAADSDPGHFVPFPQDMPNPTSHFTVQRNGHTLISATGTFGAVIRNLPATPATYRAVLTDDLSHLPGISQSTHTITELTIHYPGHGAALPGRDTCPGRSPATPCQILPVPTLNYELATNDLNTSTSHTQVLHLQAGHASYDGQGSTATITSAQVSVSFNGGRTWHTAHLTGTAGTYTATWPNSAARPGVTPTLKVTATDSAGNTITQTITNAYTLGTTRSSTTTP